MPSNDPELQDMLNQLASVRDQATPDEQAQIDQLIGTHAPQGTPPDKSVLQQIWDASTGSLAKQAENHYTAIKEGIKSIAPEIPEISSALMLGTLGGIVGNAPGAALGAMAGGSLGHIGFNPTPVKSLDDVADHALQTVLWGFGSGEAAPAAKVIVEGASPAEISNVTDQSVQRLAGALKVPLNPEGAKAASGLVNDLRSNIGTIKALSPTPIRTFKQFAQAVENAKDVMWEKGINPFFDFFKRDVVPQTSNPLEYLTEGMDKSHLADPSLMKELQGRAARLQSNLVSVGDFRDALVDRNKQLQEVYNRLGTRNLAVVQADSKGGELLAESKWIRDNLYKAMDANPNVPEDFRALNKKYGQLEGLSQRASDLQTNYDIVGKQEALRPMISKLADRVRVYVGPSMVPHAGMHIGNAVTESLVPSVNNPDYAVSTAFRALDMVPGSNIRDILKNSFRTLTSEGSGRKMLPPSSAEVLPTDIPAHVAEPYTTGSFGQEGFPKYPPNFQGTENSPLRIPPSASPADLAPDFSDLNYRVTIPEEFQPTETYPRTLGERINIESGASKKGPVQTRFRKKSQGDYHD